MSAPKMNALAILKHLNRSNCRKCGLPTCMAFAAQVATGGRDPADCPDLDPEVAARLRGENVPQREPGADRRIQRVLELKAKVAELDFAERAEQMGGRIVDDQMEFLCLGRRFAIDRQGELHSELHINSWIHMPLLTYVTMGRGADPIGRWVRFAELSNTRDWARFFEHRCENVLKEVADEHFEMFVDMLDIFGGEPVAQAELGNARFEGVARRIVPIPKVPVLVRYWEEGDGFGSELRVLFDSTADKNLDGDSLYQLIGGIVEMLKKISQRHG